MKEKDYPERIYCNSFYTEKDMGNYNVKPHFMSDNVEYVRADTLKWHDTKKELPKVGKAIPVSKDVLAQDGCGYVAIANLCKISGHCVWDSVSNLLDCNNIVAWRLIPDMDLKQ